MEKKSYRMTKQRKIIHELLMKYPTHPTAEVLYERVKKILPDISLGTVYRNLEVLCEQGYAIKVPSMDKKMHFDADTTAHLHIQCEECGIIADFRSENIDINKKEIEKCSGFECSGYKIKIYGLCPKCLKTKK